ncbi:MAG: PAS domain-containing protein [Coriobacteriia bacterium]|nr:PAS domain-containing protein [Coriobacteriia bacterium]
MSSAVAPDDHLVALLASALDFVPNPLIVTDYADVFWVNTAAVTEYRASSRDELCQLRALELAHPDSRDAVRSRRDLVLDGRQPMSGVPLKTMRCDGVAASHIIDVIPIDVDGAAAILGVFHSVVAPTPPTVTWPLGSSETSGFVAAAFEAVPTPLLLHDQQQVIAANAACRLAFADDGEDLVGRSIHDLSDPDSLEIERARRSAMEQGEVRTLWRVPLKMRRLDGTPLHITASGALLTVDGRYAALMMVEQG